MKERSVSLMPTQIGELLIQEINAEIIVYSHSGSRVVYLNPVAGLVFRHCQEQCTEEEVCNLIATTFGSSDPQELLDQSLDLLLEHRLVKAGSTFLSSRRNFLKQLSTAAALAPVVTSITIPDPASAASCKALGTTPCGAAAECCGSVADRRCFNNSCTGGISMCCLRFSGTGCTPGMNSTCCNPASQVDCNVCCSSGPFINQCRLGIGSACFANTDCCSNNCGGGGVCA
jgi:hypothetical protein